MTTDITEHIIVVLHDDNWEADLKSLATEKPLQEWIQLAQDIKRGKYVIRKPSSQLNARIQVLLVDAGLITDQAFVESLQGIERFDAA
jgi:hypothetical protein